MKVTIYTDNQGLLKIQNQDYSERDGVFSHINSNGYLIHKDNNDLVMIRKRDFNENTSKNIGEVELPDTILSY